MKYYVIGDEDTVLGFSMVGVEGSIVRNESEADAEFQKALSQADTGIIIITESIAEIIRARVDQYLFSKEFPLIVEIPDRKGRMPGKKTIREMVNQSIGVKV